MSSATVAADSRRTGQGAPGLGAVIASEWLKQTSLRSTWITSALAVVLGIGGTVMVAVIVGVTWDSWGSEERAQYDPVLTPTTGLIFTGLVLVVLGVRAGASEYASGMMRLTLTATPRRGRLLAAKAIVVTALTILVGAVAIVGMYLVGNAVLADYGLETAPISDGGAARVLAASIALGPFFPLAGLCFGVALRSTAGAITTVLAFIFAPAIFGGLLPSWWDENVADRLPGAAVDSLVYGHLDESLAIMSPAAALATLAGWTAFFLAIALVALERRDA